MELLCKSTQIALKVEQPLYLTDVMLLSPTALLLVILLHCNIIIHRGAVLLNICLNILAVSKRLTKRETHTISLITSYIS